MMSLHYSFLRADVTPTPAHPSGVIYRPVIPIWIGPVDGPRRPFLGLLDTGADDTALAISVADRLGVTLDRDHPIPFRGVGGWTVGYFGEVRIELRQSPRSYVWAARVAFLPDPVDATPEDLSSVSLGHTGFFRHFNAGFDFQRLRLKLSPNSLFVGLPR